MVLMAIVYLVLVQTVVGETPSRGDALTEDWFESLEMDLWKSGAVAKLLTPRVDQSKCTTSIIYVPLPFPFNLVRRTPCKFGNLQHCHHPPSSCQFGTPANRALLPQPVPPPIRHRRIPTLLMRKWADETV